MFCGGLAGIEGFDEVCGFFGNGCVIEDVDEIAGAHNDEAANKKGSDNFVEDEGIFIVFHGRK